MDRHRMKIAILTSSRADYGIYLPLLRTLEKEKEIDFEIIAFGTHLAKDFGNTIDQILADGFSVSYSIDTLPKGDTAIDITCSLSKTIATFGKFWDAHRLEYDWVLCLGDRYEMFGAVTAGIPFGIRFAHIHGGETTLGAMDNIFRDAITHASKLHFTSCEQHRQRVENLISGSKNVYNVGALSLENLANIPLYSIKEFKDYFFVDLSVPTILSTIHPETVNPENNQNFVEEYSKAILSLEDYQILITLPNTDTNNSVIRERLLKLPGETQNRVICIENLGTRGYFSAMKHCCFIMGNSSSGIIEAASFGKYVINIGDRQKGRFCSENMINTSFNSSKINEIIKSIPKQPFQGKNIFYKPDSSKIIIKIIKETSVSNL